MSESNRNINGEKVLGDTGGQNTSTLVITQAQT